MFSFSVWILLLILIVTVSVLVLFIQLRSLKALKAKLEKKELEYKHQTYENLILDLIHQRFGYVIDVNKILDTVLESLSSIIGYTTASYLLISPAKLRYRFHLFEQVPKIYAENLKEQLLHYVSRNYSAIQIPNYLEETVSGNLINDNLNITPKSTIEIPVVIEDQFVGVINISSQFANFYSDADVKLAKKSLERVFNEVSRLKKLVDSEKTKLEVMVDNMTSGVVLVDEDFTVITLNSACAEMLDLKNRYDATIFDIVGAFDSSLPLDIALSEVFQKGETKKFENVDLKKRVLNINILPITKSVSKKTLCIIISDVTDERRFAQMKDDFISMMVHELRSPLTIIKGSADVMLKRSDTLDKAQEKTLIEQVKLSSAKLLDLVNDLLDTAKIEAGKLSIKKDLADINKILIQEVNDFMPLAKEKQLNLHVDTDVNIGEFYFDSDRIQQVLNNLISNSLKFTEKGEIVVSSKLNNQMVEISVADSGIGIKDEDKKDLFNKYSQLENDHAPKEKGTGLGLVITKGLIEAHGGTITVEHNKPQGSIFKFTLPLTYASS